MIQLYLSPGSRTRKAFEEAVPDSRMRMQVQVTEAHRDTKPKQAHLVLVAGKSAATKEMEKFAARLGAFPVCVPEAGEWLQREISRRLELGMPLVMVDAALASTSQLSGAK